MLEEAANRKKAINLYPSSTQLRFFNHLISGIVNKWSVMTIYVVVIIYVHEYQTVHRPLNTTLTFKRGGMYHLQKNRHEEMTLS